LKDVEQIYNDSVAIENKIRVCNSILPAIYGKADPLLWKTSCTSFKQIPSKSIRLMVLSLLKVPLEDYLSLWKWLHKSEMDNCLE
jgi:hypothetical protein